MVTVPVAALNNELEWPVPPCILGVLAVREPEHPARDGAEVPDDGVTFQSRLRHEVLVVAVSKG